MAAIGTLIAPSRLIANLSTGCLLITSKCWNPVFSSSPHDVFYSRQIQSFDPHLNRCLQNVSNFNKSIFLLFSNELYPFIILTKRSFFLRFRGRRVLKILLEKD